MTTLKILAVVAPAALVFWLVLRFERYSGASITSFSHGLLASSGSASCWYWASDSTCGSPQTFHTAIR